MSDDLLDAIRDLPKVCPYLHVPAQSGCNDILKRMKRLYTVEFYRDMLASTAARRCRAWPSAAISSSASAAKRKNRSSAPVTWSGEAGFKNSFIFKYSPRPGTKGQELYADDVPEEVKKRRNNDLLAIQNAVSLQDHLGKVGETVEVLVEGPSKTSMKHASNSGPVQLTGRTRTDHIVVFEGSERLVGQTVSVVIEEATAFTLFGTVVKDRKVPEGFNIGVSGPATLRIELPVV